MAGFESRCSGAHFASLTGDVVAGEILLFDETGTRRESFSIGEAVFVAGRGLKPLSLYEFRLRREALPLGRLSTDRHGTSPPTALLCQGDMLDLKPGALEMEVRGPGRSGRPFRVKFRLEESRVPRIFPCDAHGQLVTGFQEGDELAFLGLAHCPAGCVRIFAVRRQFGWRVGDPIESVLEATVRHDGSPHRTVPLGGFPPGSYQFIARIHLPGWYEADKLSLLPSDIVSDRCFASLVVRRRFATRLEYNNGVLLTPEVAGRPLAHRPYFRFVNNFPRGTDVYAALDPDALPAGLHSRRAAIYVIRHKTAAEWAASNALDDISGPGMTPAVKIVPVVPGCVNWNTTLVWPNPQTPGQYDIAIDFGNNERDPSQFATDGTLDSPLDMIDGYVRVGFYVTDDPSLPGPYAGKIGQYDYALGTITVPSTDAGPTPTDSVPLTASIRYPAQTAGTDAPFAPGAFPLVIIMHGNSGYDSSYLGYNYLLDHLASHGFIALSIYAPIGAMIETRARAILAHLSVMAQNNANSGLFQGHVDLTAVGIVGHSRGGEAVVRAARINTAETLGWNLRAGISIAPTDYFHYGDPGIPLLVIYGSNDGDVSGAWPNRTCFDIYDEAGRPRSFVFVYGATHDQFNTVWAPTALNVEIDIAPSDVPNLISLADHENVAKGYVTAYLQAYLLGRREQLEYFSAKLKPSLVSGVAIHISHQEPGVEVVDNFEQVPHDPSSNTLGGAVTGTSLAELAENALRTLDQHSPHVTGGADIAWQTSAGIYLTRIPAMASDVSGYRVLAFRATQRYGSPKNPANQQQDFFVRLTDGYGKSRAIRAGVFTDVPYPWVRGYSDLIKSAMKTVRIPLESYVIANLGAQHVDLTNIASISFEFTVEQAGEIEIDDVEFSE